MSASFTCCARSASLARSTFMSARRCRVDDDVPEEMADAESGTEMALSASSKTSTHTGGAGIAGEYAEAPEVLQLFLGEG